MCVAAYVIVAYINQYSLDLCNEPSIKLGRCSFTPAVRAEMKTSVSVCVCVSVRESGREGVYMFPVLNDGTSVCA